MRSSVKALLKDTLVGGQLYLRLPSQNPVKNPIQTLYLLIPVRDIVVSGSGHFERLRSRIFLVLKLSLVDTRKKLALTLKDTRQHCKLLLLFVATIFPLEL